MLRWREFDLLLIAAAFFAGATAIDHGHYSLRALGLLLIGVAAFIGAARLRAGAAAESTGAGDDATTTRLAGLVLAILLVIGITDLPGYSLGAGAFSRAYTLHNGALALLAGIIVLVPRSGSNAGQRTGHLWPGLAVVGFASALVLRIGIIVESPAPAIDIFTQFQESAQHLLGGLNPYQTPVSDPSDAAARFGYTVTAYSYPPAGLYFQAAAFAVLGDIRYAGIVADAVTAAAIVALVPATRRATGVLLALIFLHQPRSLFVLEQAWNEPLLIAAAAVACWLFATRPSSRWVGAAVGFFLALKQYLVFFAIAFVFRRERWRTAAIAAATIVALWVPFLLWDADSATRNGLLFQFATPFRPDGLTLSSLAHELAGWTPSKWVAVGAGTATTMSLGFLLRDDGRISAWLYAAVAGTLAAFLVGSQAFANYYHFVGSLLLVLSAVRLRGE